MQARTFASTVLAAALAASALPALAGVGISIDIGPPAPRYEVAPAPRAGYVWAPGYWDYAGRRHVWVAGQWVRERPGYIYQQPTWVQANGHWVLRGGEWRAGNGRGHAYGHDRDHDGRPNGVDRDRDGDGVPNRYDARPDNPRRN